MDTEGALLRAIEREPGDDLGWRALADHLEEQGRSDQAEVLRLRLALPGLGRKRKKRREGEARLCALLAAGTAPAGPTLTNVLGMLFVLVPAGSFWRGSPQNEKQRSSDEGPLRQVTLTRPFYLGAHLVTQGQYWRVMDRGPSSFAPGGPCQEQVAGINTGAFPVERVTWHDALAFCEALSRREEEQAAGRVYRLPSEAEWEYACRAAGAHSTAFHCGPALGAEQANINGKRPYGDAPQGPYLNRPTPVGSYAPNALGLYDMHGNVWEWCADWYEQHYYRDGPVVDPTGPADGTNRILRGGCWYWHGREARAAFRSRVEPTYVNYCVGFRVALTWRAEG
jgi:uncharacterized protein (TIGR02996 family)